MSFVVPPEIARDVNRHSGFLKTGSRYAEKSLKGLFASPENINFVSRSIGELVTQNQFIADATDGNLAKEDWSGKAAVRNPEPRLYRGSVEPRHEQLARAFSGSVDFIREYTFELMESYQIPYDEDWVNANPVQQLHYLNRTFILDTANTIVQNPEIVIANFEDINPDTGVDESQLEYEYSARSYADGVWRPEELFINSRQNRENPEWALIRHEFSNTPDARGPGNRYKVLADGKDVRGIYTQEEYDRRFENMTNREMLSYDLMAENNIELRPRALDLANDDDIEDIETILNKRIHDYEPRSSKPRNERFSRGGQIPFWQTTVHTRQYEKNIDEALSDGGIGDRRTQRPHGYDMSTLTNRSSKHKIPVRLDRSGKTPL